MIAQPIVSTPTKQPQAGQARPPASANGFLSLLSPDRAAKYAAARPSVLGPVRRSRPTPTRAAIRRTMPTRHRRLIYRRPRVQATIVPTAAANQPAPSPISIDQNAALQAGANQLSLNGSAIPSNPVLPASNSADAGRRNLPRPHRRRTAKPIRTPPAAQPAGTRISAPIYPAHRRWCSDLCLAAQRGPPRAPPHGPLRRRMHRPVPRQRRATTRRKRRAAKPAPSRLCRLPDTTTAAPTLPLHPNHDSADQN